MHHFSRPITIDGLATISIKELEENYQFAGHIHQTVWEMVYVIDGYVGVTAGDRIVKCRPGSIIFHQPTEFHRLWNAGKGNIIIMIVSFAASGDSLDGLREKMLTLTNDELSAMRKLQGMILDNATQEIEELSAKQAFYNDNFLASQFVTLLEHVFYCCAKSTNVITSKSTKDSHLFSLAVKNMKQHIGDAYTVKELADELQINQNRLKRLFQHYAQTGVHEYYLALKISHAKTLLSQGASVYDAANAVGFNDQNYFSTVFKRITGVSPSKWQGDD